MSDFVSYSQNFEDVMLMRALRNVAAGFYIDVGAQGPSEGSVTKAFYDRGWRGINFEPLDDFIKLLAAERTRDINDRRVVGAADGRVVFYDIEGTGLSTSVEAIAQTHAAQGKKVHRRHVEMITLDTACQQYGVDTVHFLKVDTEGSEKEVLLGFSFDKVRPWIVVVEATYPNSPEPNFESWEPLLLSKRYVYAYSDGLNRFYVAEERRELLNHFIYPPNYFDDFALAATERARKQVAHLLGECERAAALQDNYRQVIDHHVAIIDEMGTRIANLQVRSTELDNVLASTSWRITAPLRRVSHLLARVKRVSRRLLGSKAAVPELMISERHFVELPEGATWIASKLKNGNPTSES